MMDRTREDGSILVLTIFYGFLSLVLILLVVASTSLYLERKRLFTLADGAALYGAEAFDLDDVTVTATDLRPVLDSADVADAVADYVNRTASGSLEAAAIDRAESLDGRTAIVSLSSYWRPPIVSMLVPDGFRIEVTVAARSVFF